MSEQNSNIEYPKLTLGGVEYEGRMTRGYLACKVSQTGINMADLNDPGKAFYTVFRIVHLLIGDRFEGTYEELANLALEENKVKECRAFVDEAFAKVLPPPINPQQVAAPRTAALPN